VRAGIIDDPADFVVSVYGEACGGSRRATAARKRLPFPSWCLAISVACQAMRGRRREGMGREQSSCREYTRCGFRGLYRLLGEEEFVTAIADTNAISDVLLRREPFFAHSAEVVDRAERGDYTGLICVTTMTTISTFLVTISARKRHWRA